MACLRNLAVAWAGQSRRHQTLQSRRSTLPSSSTPTPEGSAAPSMPSSDPGRRIKQALQ